MKDKLIGEDQLSLRSGIEEERRREEHTFLEFDLRGVVKLVRNVRLELTRLSTAVSKTAMATITSVPQIGLSGRDRTCEYSVPNRDDYHFRYA